MSNPAITRLSFVPACVLAIVLACALPLFSCTREDAPQPATPTSTRSTATYSTRGTIEALPDPSRRGSLLQIHHERIADFKSRDGAVVGMNEMVMPFPLAPGVTTDGLAVGDRVEFEFAVDWDATPPYAVTRIRKAAVPASDPAPSAGVP